MDDSKRSHDDIEDISKEERAEAEALARLLEGDTAGGGAAIGTPFADAEFLRARSGEALPHELHERTRARALAPLIGGENASPHQVEGTQGTNVRRLFVSTRAAFGAFAVAAGVLLSFYGLREKRESSVAAKYDSSSASSDGELALAQSRYLATRRSDESEIRASEAALQRSLRSHREELLASYQAGKP